jgi:hypothetical protein
LKAKQADLQACAARRALNAPEGLEGLGGYFQPDHRQTSGIPDKFKLFYHNPADKIKRRGPPGAAGRGHPSGQGRPDVCPESNFPKIEHVSCRLGEIVSIS